MVRNAPPVADVMKEAARFVGDTPLLAHNASFDQKFWQAELRRVGYSQSIPFACSLLLSRRIFQSAPNHKLETLVQTLRLPKQGSFHRAMADAECTAHLLFRIQQELSSRFNLKTINHDTLVMLQKASKQDLTKCIRHLGGSI